jgi:branched-chain amino acid aminotransferase
VSQRDSLESTYDDSLAELKVPSLPILRLEEGYAYFQGKIVPLHEAKVSIATHALQYGTTCYEGIRAYWNAEQSQLYILKLREHYERMARSWNVLQMRPKESVDDLCRITIELVRTHGYHEDIYIRPLTYKSSHTIKLTLSSLDDAVGIYCFALGSSVKNTSGLSVCTSAWRRAHSNALPVRAKVGGAYVNSSLAVDDATLAGFDEAILLTHDGTVSEASTSNVFLVRNGKLATPALSEDILEGITRNAVIGMVRDEFGMTVEERRIDRTELYAADEIFLSATGLQVCAVTSVDHRMVGTGKPGPLTRQLQQLYLSACRGEKDTYRNWLTPVY